jgi:hypothetical protein
LVPALLLLDLGTLRNGERKAKPNLSLNSIFSKFCASLSRRAGCASERIAIEINNLIREIAHLQRPDDLAHENV